MDCTLNINGKRFIVAKNWKMEKGTKFLDFRSGCVGEMNDSRAFAEQVKKRAILAPVEVIKEL